MPDPGNLEDPCPACERPCGDHTLREWKVCLGGGSFYLPVEAVGEDAARILNEQLRERLNIEEGTIVADNVVCYSATIDVNSGPVGFAKLPALFFDFQTSANGKPETMAKVVFLSSDPEMMRQGGTLVRESSRAAANKAEKAA